MAVLLNRNNSYIAYFSDMFEAEQLVKEVDIHSVTGLLKSFLRELPEAVFTDDLYSKFFEAFSLGEGEPRKRKLLQLFATLPQVNQSCIVYITEHLIR